MRDRHRSRALVAMTGLAMGLTGLVSIAPAAQAVTGCSANYSVKTQWQGGFTAELAVTNLGDARSNWSVSFAFGDPGQKVSQGWNATFSQSGSTVTAANTAWNGTLPTNGSVTIGFNGTFTGANPAVATVALNGVNCTGRTTDPTPTTPVATTPGQVPVTSAPVPTTPSGPVPTNPTGNPPTGSPLSNPLWGKELPPAGAQLSHDYQMLLTAQDKGYQPRTGECSTEIHARYWTWGTDGKVYATWHPVRDPSGCSFGHEHGDDPRTANLFSSVGWPAFGYAAEVMASDPAHSEPAMQRHEDHVGHKVLAVNASDVIQGDNGTSFFKPSGTVLATCDLLWKFHQGTHSTDAFTNNMHELAASTRCTYRSDNSVSEARYTAMIPIGRPGGFSATDCPGPNLGGAFKQVGSAVPADSPSDTRSLGRLITDEACVTAIQQGKTHYEVITGTNVPFDTNDLHEFWFSDTTVSGSGLTYTISPLFYVLNPSRYYDSASATKLSRQVDLCYPGSWGQGIRGSYCDQVRSASTGSTRIAWDDARSPFKGTLREYRPGFFTVRNTGATTVYTDVYGKKASASPFPGSIKQYFSGSSQTQLYIRGATRDYATSTVHAPN